MAKVVVIGGSIMGSSLAYHMAMAGEADAVFHYRARSRLRMGGGASIGRWCAVDAQFAREHRDVALRAERLSEFR